MKASNIAEIVLDPTLFLRFNAGVPDDLLQIKPLYL